MNERRRVVVTGVGMVTPLANDVVATWQALLAGRSGIRPLRHLDTDAFTVKIGGSVCDLSLEGFLSARDARKMDHFIRYGMVAGIQAMNDSGLQVHEGNASRVGVMMGSGIGGLPGIEQGVKTCLERGPRRLSPFYVPANIINMISGHLAIRYGAMGPNYAITSACATGTHNIGHAVQLIRANVADAVLAGGAEMATSPTGLGGFAAARALSTRNDAPEAASRPWDRGRDGFVLSDGAGAVVLEAYEQARTRGASILAECVGYGSSCDAFHMTAPHAAGRGASLCMQNALCDARIDATEVDYINAHGTSTVIGDVAETLAIKQVFGDHAKRLAVSSSKSMTGHMLGAAGAVEAIFCLLALRDQLIPPTINLDDPDCDCDLDYVPNVARKQPIKVALSNSFGFGGANGTLVFKKIS